MNQVFSTNQTVKESYESDQLMQTSCPGVVYSNSPQDQYYYSSLIQKHGQVNNHLIQQHIERSLIRLRSIQSKNHGIVQKDVIHKVPIPIRKTLKGNKYKKAIDLKNAPVIQKRKQKQEYLSINTRKLSPKMAQYLNRNQILQQMSIKQQIGKSIVKQDSIRFSSNNDSRYQNYSLNKRQKMHFTEYKNAIDYQPKKYSNSIQKQLLIMKQFDDGVRLKVLSSIKKGPAFLAYNNQDGSIHTPKPINFLNIQGLKPLQRRQCNIFRRPSFHESNQIKNRLESKQSRQKITLQQPKQIRQQTTATPKRKNIKMLKSFVAPFEKYYYRDFIWKLAYIHNLIVDTPDQYPKPFKVYIGPGNNKLLVKSLMKRRNWWNICQNSNDCHFIWTQIKVNQIFKNQKKNQLKHKASILSQRQKEQLQIKKQKQPQKTLPSNFPEIVDHNQKIMNQQQIYLWRKYFLLHRNAQNKLKQNMAYRNKNLKKQASTKLVNSNLKIHNHLQNNYVIGNKKALYYTMSKYYEINNQNVFNYLPTTFHIQSGTEDQTYLKFLNVFYEKAKLLKKQEKQDPNSKKLRNIWIVKPGQFTNRGTGITVCLTLDQIKNIIKTKEKHANGNIKTYIVQSYLDRPFLYYRRKFDIRHYMMITSINGIVRGYWYQQGYIRTTSFEYTIKSNTTGIHLTNDAIQKYLPQYGKYQKGNKLSYQDFQKYLDKQYGKKYNFFTDVYPMMKKIATDSIRASFMNIDNQKREHNFEIFGMDFMIDQNFKPWLIEINTNPCLELSCPLLGKIIPYMVQNALKIGLDPLFPPPVNLVQKNNYFVDNALETNKFQLVFDSVVDGEQIIKQYQRSKDTNIKMIQNIQQDDEVYEDEGNEWDGGI